MKTNLKTIALVSTIVVLGTGQSFGANKTASKNKVTCKLVMEIASQANGTEKTGELSKAEIARVQERAQELLIASDKDIMTITSQFDKSSSSIHKKIITGKKRANFSQLNKLLTEYDMAISTHPINESIARDSNPSLWSKIKLSLVEKKVATVNEVSAQFSDFTKSTETKRQQLTRYMSTLETNKKNTNELLNSAIQTKRQVEVEEFALQAATQKIQERIAEFKDNKQELTFEELNLLDSLTAKYQEFEVAASRLASRNLDLVNSIFGLHMHIKAVNKASNKLLFLQDTLFAKLENEAAEFVLAQELQDINHATSALDAMHAKHKLANAEMRKRNQIETAENMGTSDISIGTMREALQIQTSGVKEAARITLRNHYGEQINRFLAEETVRVQEALMKGDPEALAVIESTEFRNLPKERRNEILDILKVPKEERAIALEAFEIQLKSISEDPANPRHSLITTVTSHVTEKVVEGVTSGAKTLVGGTYSGSKRLILQGVEKAKGIRSRD